MIQKFFTTYQSIIATPGWDDLGLILRLPNLSLCLASASTLTNPSEAVF